VSRMNGKQSMMLHEALINKSGNVCQNCGALGELRQLVIDHIGNNNSNNNPENLQLLCRTCNYTKDSRKSVDMCVRTSPSISQNSSLKINKEKEPKFRKWIMEELKSSGAVDGTKMSARYIINNGAEKIGMSQVTAKRYLEKMCSHAGSLDSSGSGKEQFVGIKSPQVCS